MYDIFCVGLRGSLAYVTDISHYMAYCSGALGILFSQRTRGSVHIGHRSGSTICHQGLEALTPIFFFFVVHISGWGGWIGNFAVVGSTWDGLEADEPRKSLGNLASGLAYLYYHYHS